MSSARAGARASAWSWPGELVVAHHQPRVLRCVSGHSGAVAVAIALEQAPWTATKPPAQELAPVWRPLSRTQRSLQPHGRSVTQPRARGRALIARGCSVSVVSRSRAKLDAAVKELRELAKEAGVSGRVFSATADVGDWAQAGSPTRSRALRHTAVSLSSWR